MSSSLVFIKDKELAWIPAIQTGESGGKATVDVPQYKDEQSIACDNSRGAKGKETKTVNLKDYTAGVLPLQNVDNNGNLLEFPDMVELPYLHEAGILFNLKKRHWDGKPYTRTGDIIIAINPFQWFTHLYTEKKRTYYSNRIVWTTESGDTDPRKSMEPHIYETSSLVFKGLAFEKYPQSILVSGESGAGKTETVKICMNHIASVQRGPIADTGDDKFEDPVVNRILQSNPLLEAYGNAKTTRNDNSSRFGKYLQLQFEDQALNAPIISKTESKCFLAGSKCEAYLLEKNRVTGHEDVERSYHCFYQMCAAPDDDKQDIWPALVGKGETDFKYVGKSPPGTKIEGMTDEEHFKNTSDVLRLIDVDGEKYTGMMRGICTVMQIGNITFGPKDGDTDKSVVTSAGENKLCSELMGVGEEDINLAFTERTMKTRNEEYKVPLNPDAAKDSADALAKEIYNKIFLWLVDQINLATAAEMNYRKKDTVQYGTIGLLDIFGFETFKINRFEQLCINFANEKLQQKFTEDIFMSVQAEYEAEGIELAEITFDDNTDVLDLIEGRTGVMAMLNEECVRPKGNDETFVNKAIGANKKSPALIVNPMNKRGFGVHHFAGKVMYDGEFFVTRNQDSLPSDLEDCMFKSTNFLISLKPAEPEGGAAPKRTKSNLVGSTVWNKYKTQLTSLMTELRKTKSRYIRCLKPNKPKKPQLMEHMSTVEQLRCAGVVAAVTITRSAFPNRLDNETARLRFASMWDKSKYPMPNTDGMGKPEKLKAECEVLFTCALKEKEDDGKQAFVVGKTRTYFRAGALEYLEANRAAGMDGQAVTVQKLVRGHLARKKTHALLHGKAEQERLEREAKEREAKEEAERKEALARELEIQRQRELAEQEARKEKAKNEMDKLEQEKKNQLRDLEQRLEDAKLEQQQLEEATSEEARLMILEPKKQAAAHQSKIDMNTKEIEFLQKEAKKIKKEHAKVKKKFDELANNNKKLMEQNEKAGGLFGSENDGAVSIHKKNEMLQEELEVVKKDHKQLKDDVGAKQREYMATAEARLEFQKTMARILNLIQDNCKDHQLIEDTVCIAFDAEKESKLIMAQLEAEFG